MDGSRFDRITRTLATSVTRRRTLLGLSGSAVAGILGLSQVEDAAACVKAGRKGCGGPNNKKCCSGATCQGGSKDKEGRCECKGSLKECKGKCVNTKKDRKNCGGCNRRCVAGNTCKNGACTSKLGCKAGQGRTICDTGEPTFCPGRTDCACLTDVQGGAHCSDFQDGVCADCTKNADCGPGRICFRAAGTACNCAGEPGSNGNACISATCDGITGSGPGRGRLRTPLLR